MKEKSEKKSRKYPQKLGIAANRHQKEKEYWLKKLSDAPAKAQFPMDAAHLNEPGQYGALAFKFSPRLSKKMIELSGGSDVRLFMILTAGLLILLAKYSGEQDILLGTTIYKQEADGDLINSALVLRNNVAGDMSVKDLILQVRNTVNEANVYANYPVEILSDSLYAGEDETTDDFPLFDTALLLDNIQDIKYLDHIRNNMTYRFHKVGNNIDVHVKFNGGLYSPAAVKKYTVNLSNLFTECVADVNIKIKDLEFLTNEEKQKLLDEFNAEIVIPAGLSIPRLFEMEAEKNPQAAALIYGDEYLTYRQLNIEAAKLACALQRSGMGKDKTAGILLERSPLMVISILAVWKAGGAYIPISGDTPVQRIVEILTDSDTEILVTAPGYFDREAGSRYSGEVFTLDGSPGRGFLETQSPDIRELNSVVIPGKIGMSDLAYVIYTSGSTGKPKGVMIEHIGMLNHIRSKIETLGLSEIDIIAQNSPHTFDISIWQFFAAIVIGSRISIIPDRLVLNPKRFISRVLRDKITILEVVPSYLNAILEILASDEVRLNSLRYLVVTGEEVKRELVEKWFERFPAIKMVNVYGPTEAADDITYFVMDSAPATGDIPIGKPLRNFNIVIVDPDMKLCPIGVPGEICVFGAGVGRGYLNKPEITDGIFTKNPYSGNKMMRLYKTGDRGLWTDEGIIRFLGRVDFQVKIRGFRIELNEIEKVLVSLPYIKKAYIMDRKEDSGNQYLCAYIIPGNVDSGASRPAPGEGRIDTAAIKNYLKLRLPHYMIPAFFVEMGEFPLTANGKIDRKAFPAPGTDKQDDYVCPEDKTEKRLAYMWSEILNISVDVIGRTANFFDLGGHSLRATLLAAQIYKEFGVEILLRDIFQNPVLSELSSVIKNSERSRYISIQPIEKKTHYPVSAAEYRMFILKQFEQSGISYNMPWVTMIEGKSDKDRLGEKFREIIKRHEALRTTFEIRDGLPVRIIHDAPDFVLEYEEYATGDELSGEESKELRKKILDFIRPFDIGRLPLVRAKLLKLNNSRHLLMYDLHHIISDGVSTGILVRDFVDLYTTNGAAPAPLKVQYKDYADWQQRLFRSEIINKQEQYWLDIFSGDLPTPELPLDFDRPAVLRYEGDTYRFDLDNSLVARLNRIAADKNTGIFTVLFTAYNILLYKVSGQRDIIVGTTTAGRNHADLEGVMGMFVNAVALRNFLQPEESFADFLEKVKVNSIKAFENQDYQFDMLIDKLGIQRNLSRSPLYDTMFNLENMYNVEHRQKMALEYLRFTPFEFDSFQTKDDINISIYETEDGIRFNCDYRSYLFKKKTIVYLMQQYVKLLEAIAADPGLKINDYLVFDPKELRVHENTVEIKIPFSTFEPDKKNNNIIEIWEEKVEQSPASTALCFRETRSGGSQYFTYQTLNEQANRVAFALSGCDTCAPEQNVLLLFEHGAASLTAILGVLKAGLTYVPLDAGFPMERLLRIIADSRADIILTDKNKENMARQLAHRAAKFLKVLVLEQLSGEKENPGIDILPQQVACILYTSGSTGQPKGVLQTHRNIVSLIAEYINLLKINGRDKVALLTPYTHAVSVIDIFSALFSGAVVYPYPLKTADSIERLSGWLKKHKITIYHSVPTVYRYLISRLKDKEILSSPRLIILGGETVSNRDVEDYKNHFNENCIFVNLFGCTELLLASALLIDKHTEPGKAVISIGYAFPGVYIRILDEQEREQGIYGTGEIVYCSPFLSPGYFREHEQNPTEEKSGSSERGTLIGRTPAAISGGQESGIYHSGDLGRRLPDGSLEYLGRRDQQVKLRGNRVELLEIELSLSSFPGISRGVADVRQKDGADKYLAAYYVGQEGIAVNENELRKYMAEHLPDYMVPAYYMEIAELPLTATAKVDKKRLPDAAGEKVEKRIYMEPGSPVEKKLTAIWQELLGMERISAADNFFELGGHSLTAATMIARIQKEFRVEIHMDDIFNNQHLASLARLITESAAGSQTDIYPVEKREYYISSAGQRRMFVLNQMEGDSTAYNVPETREIIGPLDKDRLERTLLKLICRHEALRSYFEMKDGEPVQKIKNDSDFHLEYNDLWKEVDNSKETKADPGTTQERDKKVAEILRRFIRPFQLDKAPLFRACLIKTGEQTHLLVYDMHHIITDGTSMVVLLAEFGRLYNGEELPELRICYKDYAEWQNRFRKQGRWAGQKDFWTDIFRQPLPVPDLPTDYARQEDKSFSGERLSFFVDEEIANDIGRLCLEFNVTLFMVMLAVYSVLLYKYTTHEDIIIGTPTAGRNYADLENIIGIFINTLAMRTFPQGHKRFIDFLADVKENALQSFSNRDYPFEELVENLSLKRDSGRNPLFDTMLMVQNMNRRGEEAGSLRFREYPLHREAALFDISIIVDESDDLLKITIEYCTGLFKEKTIRDMQKHFLNILQAITLDPEQTLAEIDILGDDEGDIFLADVLRESDEDYNF